MTIVTNFSPSNMSSQQFILMIMLLVAAEADNDEQEKRRTFRSKLTLEGRRRRDRRLPRASLRSPRFSPWSFLYASGNDQALITATGLDHKSFSDLKALFEPLYDRYVLTCEGEIRVRTKKGGRQRMLDCAACLGLALMWTRTRGSEWILSSQFGLTGTPISVWVRFTMRLLVSVLYKNEIAAVRMPSLEEIEEFKHAVHYRHSLLEDVYCVADGLKLYLQQAGDAVIQSRFYNGWTHDHYIGNIFVFAPNGTVIAAVLNAPGSMHDSCIADFGFLYDKLQVILICVVESA